MSAAYVEQRDDVHMVAGSRVSLDAKELYLNGNVVGKIQSPERLTGMPTIDSFRAITILRAG